MGTTEQLRPWQVGAKEQRDEMGTLIERWSECGHCGRTWNDALITSRTPAPSARCPFEDEHVYPEPTDDATEEVDRLRDANQALHTQRDTARRAYEDTLAERDEARAELATLKATTDPANVTADQAIAALELVASLRRPAGELVAGDRVVYLSYGRYVSAVIESVVPALGMSNEVVVCTIDGEMWRCSARNTRCLVAAS